MNEIHGTKVTGPSGVVFTVREQNGADDELLSKLHAGSGNELDILNQFLAGIIVSIDEVTPVTTDMILNLRLRDKYAILIQARILSLGGTMKFEYQWDKDKPPTEYSEELGIFVWDYSKPFPEVNSSDYSYQRIPPYISKEPLELKTDRGHYKFDYLDGHGEEILFKEAVSTINSPLVARNMEIETKAGFAKVVNFAEISSRELSKIRAFVEKNDQIPVAEVTIENPFTAAKEIVPLLAIRDFFFPTLL